MDHEPSRTPERAPAWLLALDVASVLLFVLIGRASHAKGEALAGVMSTLWPFAAGMAAGWLADRAWRRPASILPTGVCTWLGCAGFGMVLRVLAGQGTALAFVFVALAFLGLFMLGWRIASGLLLRRPRPRPLG